MTTILRSVVVLLLFLIAGMMPQTIRAQTSPRWWPVQAIDTMKYSRDPSREFLGKMDEAESIIDFQIRQIADTGATHVAIATPYDEEFLPLLKLWVTSARNSNLKVWFRGNWSGWEGWFDYPKMTREEHIAKTKSFIVSHPELFVDGDIFTACPECENGGPGDPRMHTDPAGYTQFLIDEHIVVEAAFREIDKHVITNFYSSNGDVARLIMTPQTTATLGGVVTVDHYVKSPDTLINDIKKYHQASHGKVVLGEFGAPIPDIHGEMTEEEQADWLEQFFTQAIHLPELHGMNYWTSYGGSTQLWNEDGTPRLAAKIIKKYYTPTTFTAVISDHNNVAIPNATITISSRNFTSDRDGSVEIPFVNDAQQVTISASNFGTIQTTVKEIQQSQGSITLTSLTGEKASMFQTFLIRLKNLLSAVFNF